MTDFLIVARVSAPDGLIEQARLLAKIADAIEPFQKALTEAVGKNAIVEIARGRARKKAATNGAREPRRTKTVSRTPWSREPTVPAATEPKLDIE